MNGKGDHRRPMLIDKGQYEQNWENTFNHPETVELPKRDRAICHICHGRGFSALTPAIAVTCAMCKGSGVELSRADFLLYA